MLQARSNQQEPAIETLLESIERANPRSLDTATCQALTQFFRLYFNGAPHDDLVSYLPEDLNGAAQSHWHQCQQRKAGSHRLSVFNPEFAVRGWQSSHTIIEIVAEDQPWLVASLQATLAAKHLSVHLLLHPILTIVRDDAGNALQFKPNHLTPVSSVLGTAPESLPAHRSGVPGRQNQTLGQRHQTKESLIHVQVDRVDDSELPKLKKHLDDALRMLKAIHLEQSAMQETLVALADTAHTHNEFLEWLMEKRFICFGTATLRANGEPVLESTLGFLNPEHKFFWPIHEQLTEDALAALRASDTKLTISKAAAKSPIVRDEFADIILVPRENSVTVVLGLFASSLRYQTTQSIPLLRDRIATAIAASNQAPDTHDGEALERVLRGFPRQMLLQTGPTELLEMAKRIVALQERQQIRLFYSVDPLKRFYNCLVYIPRDTYSRELRYNIEAILLAGLMGESLDFHTAFSSESALARLHFVVRRRAPYTHSVDWVSIEKRVQSAAITWHDQLLATLRDQHDETTALTLFKKYANGFSENYRDDYSARAAVADIDFMECANLTRGPVMSFYRHIFADSNTINFKLFSADQPVSLSNAIPIIENMGLRVEAGHPFEINRAGENSIWIHEFTAEFAGEGTHEASQSATRVQAAWLHIWREEVENDGFNQLILEAGLTSREVVVLRSYCKYLLQIDIPFSQSYMIECLVGNSAIARLLIGLFNERFDPAITTRNAQAIVGAIADALDHVASLDEERILRSYLNLIQSTLRTNCYCVSATGDSLDYLSFKFDSSEVQDLPLPRPTVEIFVCSPKLEAIHLRGGKVARGGLRWSDRREDFRTEVLGLMKAQRVKNAVIVPVGSKGGFFVKLPQSTKRDVNLQNAVRCYETFLCGMLDVTDNIVNGSIVSPENVVRYDDDDPYLVVAADKGTATFSDCANAVSKQYNFWLGDAFASGGSAGYDHKKMGITAKGAWESVKRHFRELNINTQTDPITTVGIGDMAGDVFGNGMLLSTEIRLVAAFNHQHIFIDPNPEPVRSFEERKRLFHLVRSSWTDYDKSLLSPGGDIYSRQDKKITLSAEARELLDTDVVTLNPNELISLLLKAPIDLLWNGGIGTYIKASTETHQDAADRSNDVLRINATNLNCRVLGEGGNLGVTQRARIEFARSGGKIYTDAIDNSAGVDCSDHEVNIKILLNSVVHNQDLTVKQRDELLVEMTDEVATLVLRDNYLQTQCINLVKTEATPALDEHAMFMLHLESIDRLDRDIEFLPHQEEIADRLANGEGLSTPEIAVLVSYSKLVMYDDLLASSISEDSALQAPLIDYFPKPIQSRFSDQILEHRLRSEIICNIVTNELVNRLGPTFAYRMHRELGASAADVAGAFIAVRSIFNMPKLWKSIEALDNEVSSSIQSQMQLLVRGLVERATHWLLRSRSGYQTIDDVIDQFKEGVQELIDAMPDALSKPSVQTLNQRVQFFAGAGVPLDTASAVAHVVPMSSSLDIVEVSRSLVEPIETTAAVYFELGRALDLQWLRKEISALSVTSHWHVLAKAELRSDLHCQQRYLAAEVISTSAQDQSAESRVAYWASINAAPLEKYTALILEIKASSDVDFAMLSLAVNEVHKLLNSDRPLAS